jgi:hypothetical protein
MIRYLLFNGFAGSGMMIMRFGGDISGAIYLANSSRSFHTEGDLPDPLFNQLGRRITESELASLHLSGI